MFPSPSLVLSILIASIYALLSHLIWGGNENSLRKNGSMDKNSAIRRREFSFGVAKLALYWAVGSLGFGLGQALSRLLPFEVLTIGEVHLLEGTLGCWSLLLIAKQLKV